jgi:hypothetical protein
MRDLSNWRQNPTSHRFAALRTLLDAIQDEPDDLDSKLKQILSGHFMLDGKPLINMHKSRTRNRPNSQGLLLADITTLGAKHELAGAPDGCKEILFMVAETFTVRDGLILIDEPELSFPTNGGRSDTLVSARLERFGAEIA